MGTKESCLSNGPNLTTNSCRLSWWVVYCQISSSVVRVGRKATTSHKCRMGGMAFVSACRMCEKSIMREGVNFMVVKISRKISVVVKTDEV